MTCCRQLKKADYKLSIKPLYLIWQNRFCNLMNNSWKCFSNMEMTATYTLRVVDQLPPCGCLTTCWCVSSSHQAAYSPFSAGRGWALSTGGNSLATGYNLAPTQIQSLKINSSREELRIPVDPGIVWLLGKIREHNGAEHSTVCTTW